MTPTQDHDLWLDVDYADTSYDNKESRLGTLDTASDVKGYKDELSFMRTQVSLGHTGRFKAGTLESSLMRTSNETEGRTIPTASRPAADPSIGTDRTRSEERRVGKECRSRWLTDHRNNKKMIAKHI